MVALADDIVSMDTTFTDSTVFLRFNPDDGTLERQGVVTPLGSRVVHNNDEFIVAKIPGHKYYGGLGQPQNYAPASYAVYQVDSDYEINRMTGRYQHVHTQEEADWIPVHPAIHFPCRV